MKRFVPAVMGLAMAACATASSSQPEPAKAAAAPEKFQAKLDARNEVPAPTLDGGAAPSGTADFAIGRLEVK